MLAQHGLRNATDIALRILGLMEDYIDAHGGWKRQTTRSSCYYAGLQLPVLMAATELIPLVRYTPVKPGWYDADFCPDHPDWANARPSPVVSQKAAVFDVEDDVEQGDDAGSAPGVLRDLPAPSRPPMRRRVRIR